MTLRTIACASVTLLAAALGTAIAAPKAASPKKATAASSPGEKLLDTPDMKLLLGPAAKIQPKLSVKAKAEKMKLPEPQVGPPFTLSARKSYEPSRGHLFAGNVNLLAASDKLTAIDSPENAFVIIELHNLQPSKRVLAECDVGAGRSNGTATLRVGALGATATQTIGHGQNRTVLLLFTPNSSTHKLHLDFKGGPWGFYGCTITPQR